MKRLVVFFLLAFSSTTGYCQTADKASDFEEINIDVYIEPYTESGGIWLMLHTEHRSADESWPEGNVLVISNGGPFEERYFLNPGPTLNSYILLLMGGGGSMSFNKSALDIYPPCIGKNYGEVTVMSGSIEIKYEPECHSYIGPFDLSVKL